MKSRERIVGFDAREMWLTDNWSDDRKNSFLIRLDVSKPLSTDVLVWPAALDEEGVGYIESYGYQGLWSELYNLRNAVNNAKFLQSKHYYTVAITLLLDGISQYDLGIWDSLIQSDLPVAPEDTWTRIGIDVSDISLLSGLMNCGFDPMMENVDYLRSKWSPYLNKYHLFSDYHAALEFKEFSNERVKEHAPFYLFGIWLIENVI